MQLSEMEEEMDQRIHAAERKTQDQVGTSSDTPDLLLSPGRLPRTNQTLLLNQHNNTSTRWSLQSYEDLVTFFQTKSSRV